MCRPGSTLAELLDVLTGASGCNTATSDKFPNHVVTGRYASGFSNTLMAKDIELYLAEVSRSGGGATFGEVTQDEPIDVPDDLIDKGYEVVGTCPERAVTAHTCVGSTSRHVTPPDQRGVLDVWRALACSTVVRPGRQRREVVLQQR